MDERPAEVPWSIDWGPAAASGDDRFGIRELKLLCKRPGYGGLPIKAVCAVTLALVPVLLVAMQSADLFDEARRRPSRPLERVHSEQ